MLAAFGGSACRASDRMAPSHKSGAEEHGSSCCIFMISSSMEEGLSSSPRAFTSALGMDRALRPHFLRGTPLDATPIPVTLGFVVKDDF